MDFLIYLLQSILCFIEYPVNVFWKYFKKYKKKKQTGKIILLFAGTLSGVLLIGGSIIYLLAYLMTYHVEWVIIAGLIFWFYGYVKSKTDKTDAETSTQNQPMLIEEKSALDLQAEKGYPIMRNIMFQTSKEVASSIGANSPRLLQEIEIPGEHYMFANNICFYQFKLTKADSTMQYDSNDRDVFREQFQNACSRLIASGSFPTLQMQNYMDAYGNWYDAVHIEIIEDIGNTFIIQSVFVTPAYTEYKHQIKLNQQNMTTYTSVPDATWK